MNITGKRKLSLLACAVFALGLTVGCGGGGDEQAADKAVPADATSHADSASVAVHDCDGTCGMKDVPMDQLTMVDGKYYCGGCVEAARKHDHPGTDH